jgi:hypothetical protein
VTITEKLQNNHASFSRRAQEIRADWTLSDAAKRQELEGLYTEARSTACPHDRRRGPLPSSRSREPGRGYEGRAVELVRPAQTEEKKGL